MRNRIEDPPWWVGESEAKKGPESNIVFISVCVFELPPPKNAEKCGYKKRKNGLDFLVDFFGKTFDTIFQVFRNVFELSSLRNTQKTR
jgi:hypothetical protein